MWLDDFDTIPKYKPGDKLVVLYADNKNWILRSKFKRAIEDNNIHLLKKSKIPKKTVLCATIDTVEFTDGSIYWTSQVCKQDEINDILHEKRKALEIKEKSLKKENFFSKIIKIFSRKAA